MQPKVLPQPRLHARRLEIRKPMLNRHPPQQVQQVKPRRRHPPHLLHDLLPHPHRTPISALQLKVYRMHPFATSIPRATRRPPPSSSPKPPASRRFPAPPPSPP